MTTLVDIVDLAVGYRSKAVIRHLDWSVRAGSLTAIVGPNGSGKSTLLKALAGEIAPLEGTISYRGLDPAGIAYLSQLSGIDRGFPICVTDVVAMGLWRKSGAFRRLGRRWAGVIDNALKTVGLDGFARRPIAHLSGGQMQRVLFARLVMQDAAIILLDEPFAAVDRETTADLIALIEGWHRDGRTVVVALHDLDQVRRTFPETLRLGSGPALLGETGRVLGAIPLNPEPTGLASFRLLPAGMARA